ncbi:hypothetical protein ACKVWC_005730 [Pyricularia oryzae]
MHLVRGLVLLALAGASAALRPRAEPVEESSPGGSKTFIVELTKGCDVESARQELQRQAPGSKVRKTFESDVFTGLSVETTDHNVESIVRGLGDAVRAWPMRMVPNPAPIVGRSFTAEEGPAAAANYSLHKYTGVEHLHRVGLSGKGVTVAIVDTGVDYSHPALGGCFGQGCKVAGGYDLAGDGDYPVGPRQPDEDPRDRKGHGTHVAGILAGKTDSFVGVAPGATLLAYKVFGSGDGAFEDILIDAFLMAYKDGADVITASIGGVGGWSDNAWAEVASRLVDAGVVVTISASNAGQTGPFFASTGASGKNVISIASAEGGDLAAEPFVVTIGGTNESTFGYVPSNAAWNITTMPVVPTSLNTSVTDDACSPLPADFPSLDGAVALIRRGGCDYAVKQRNAEAAGARFVLVYNTPTSLWAAPFSSNTNSSLALVDVPGGEAMVRAYAANQTVTVDFSRKPSHKVGVFNAAGGLPNAFTSWGPLFDMQAKPDVAAPGGNIFSTSLDGGWEVLSGTSMATPYVAGVAALYIERHGGRTLHGAALGRAVHRRIVSSGAALPWSTTDPLRTGVPNNDFGFFAPPAQVGSGMVNATKVVEYGTTIDFEPFALNDTANFQGRHEICLTNGGDAAVTYRFSLQPAGAVEMLQPFNQFGFRSRRIKDLESIATPVHIVPEVVMPDPVVVAPGETKKVVFDFSRPTVGVNETAMPLYGGKVLVTGDNAEALSVPYVGVAFSLAEQINPAWKSIEFGQWGTPPTKTWTFDLNTTVRGYPVMFASFEFGISELRWDIFEANWTEDRWSYPPVEGENGFVGSATSYSQPGRLSPFIYFDSATMQANDTFSFPLVNLVRSYPFITDSYQFWWLGAMADGSQIKSGQYTMRFAALRPLMDPANSESWAVWPVPQISVNRALSNATMQGPSGNSTRK